MATTAAGVSTFLSFYFDSCLRSAASALGLGLCELRRLLGGSGRGLPTAAHIYVVQLGHLGDALITIPLLRALRQAYPQAVLRVVTGAAGAGVFRDFAGVLVNDVVEYNSKKFARGAWTESTEVPRFSGAHLIIHVRGDLPLLLNYFTNYRAAFRHCLVPYSRLRMAPLYLLGVSAVPATKTHQYDRIREVGHALGLNLSQLPEIEVEQAWVDAARLVFGRHSLDAERAIIIHPGAPWEFRRWPLTRYAAIMQSINAKSDFRIVIIGGEEERALAAELRRLGADFIDLTGLLSLTTLAGVLHLCRLYIGNDSGPGHLAAAVGARTLTLYGPQEPELFGAIGEQCVHLRGAVYCSPCWQVHCQHPQDTCMNRIGIREVELAVARILQLQISVG